MPDPTPVAGGPAAVAAVAASPVAEPRLPVVPLRDLVPWALFALVLGAVLLYLVGAEQGATAVFPGQWLHEFAHDGRHLLGFPCH